MPERHKILLLDDEQEILDLFRELLKQIPSQPEIYACNSGARAIALLESEPFNLLITDLNMPKMDGLQVLAIVRRRFPDVRVVVLTAVIEEQYRSRAYAMGVDLFWQKPSNKEEAILFQETIESVLTRGVGAGGGFRGVQSKSLVDLIQLECLSKNSCVLRICKGALEGKIWVQEGEVFDAETGDLKGEQAFREIFSWRGGNFEIQPADAKRERRITTSYQGLLLDTAQALDESKGAVPSPDTQPEGAAAVSGLAELARFEGVSFLLRVPCDEKSPVEKWGADHADPLAAWARQVQSRLRALGERLGVGELTMVQCHSSQEHVTITPRDKQLLCVGFRRELTSDQVHQTTKQICAKWAS